MVLVQLRTHTRILPAPHAINASDRPPEFGTNLVRQHDRSMLGGWFGNHLGYCLRDALMGDNIFALFVADGLTPVGVGIAHSDNIDLLELLFASSWNQSTCAFALSTKTTNPRSFFFRRQFPIANTRGPHPRANFQALRLAAVTLSAVRNVSTESRAKGQRTSVPDPQRQKRQRHRIEVRSLRRDTSERLNRSWSVALHSIAM